MSCPFPQTQVPDPHPYTKCGRYEPGTGVHGERDYRIKDTTA